MIFHFLAPNVQLLRGILITEKIRLSEIVAEYNKKNNSQTMRKKNFFIFGD